MSRAQRRAVSGSEEAGGVPMAAEGASALWGRAEQESGEEGEVGWKAFGRGRAEASRLGACRRALRPIRSWPRIKADTVLRSALLERKAGLDHRRGAP